MLHSSTYRNTNRNDITYDDYSGYDRDNRIRGTIESSSRFSSQIQNSIYQSLNKVINSANTRYELFIKLSTRLDKFFTINRTSLAFYDDDEDMMKIPYMKVEKELRNGVQINLKCHRTIMKKVLDNNTIFVRDFPHLLFGMELEKKILLDDESNSLVVIPLCYNGKKVGTLNLASSSCFVFSLLETNLFEDLFQDIARKLMDLPQ
jgi:transcriptional regulator with GAF, ATPase, and Fis domain